LDPNYGHAVVKSEEFAPTGQKTTSINCDEWQYFESAEVWLPRRSVVSFYAYWQLYANFSDAPGRLITDTLIDLNFTLPTNPVFYLAYNDPGDFFSDRTTPQAGKTIGHQVNYTVGANSNALVQGIGEFPIRRRPSVFWTCVLTMLAILPGILIMISHRKQKHK
jgi:hypothetical protein